MNRSEVMSAFHRTDAIPGTVVLKLKPQADVWQAMGHVHLHGGKVHSHLNKIGSSLVKLDVGKEEALAHALNDDGLVEWIEPNVARQHCFIPNDPSYSSQPYLAQISCPSAWDITRGSSSVMVCITDTGGEPDHPELIGKQIGYNFETNSPDYRALLTGDIHGIYVSGFVCAATNNNLEMASVGFNTVSYMVNCYAIGFGLDDYGALQGIDYVLSNYPGCRIFNSSWGGTISTSNEVAAAVAIQNAGGLWVCAAGNNNTAYAIYPAQLSTSYPNTVLSVAAVDVNDAKASFSCYGTGVQLAAPGENTEANQDGLLTLNYGGGTTSIWKGTSFSSPIVAAVAALMVSVNPAITTAQIISILTNSSYSDPTTGFSPALRRVNAQKAVQAAQGLSGIIAISGLNIDALSTLSAVSSINLDSLAGSGINPMPGAGTLSITGLRPTVVTPFNFVPGAGSISAQGYAPSLGVKTIPAVGSIAFTGAAPSLGSGIVIIPNSGSLAATGIAPFVGSLNLIPGTGSIAFTGLGTGVEPRNLSPPPGHLTFNGIAPAVGNGPGGGNLLLLGVG